MLGDTLTIVIPAVLVGYGIYLVVRMIRNRKKGWCTGGCAGCPYAGGCTLADKRAPRKKEEKNHG